MVWQVNLSIKKAAGGVPAAFYADGGRIYPAPTTLGISGFLHIR